jgi:hypothetical protein
MSAGAFDVGVLPSFRHQLFVTTDDVDFSSAIIISYSGNLIQMPRSRDETTLLTSKLT